ncbi:MAG: SDR family oxidoreductase, partial [Xanthobacteraceae bacterium]
MSQDLFKDPLSLFSVKGKTAIITGATGAFGAVAAKTLAAAGANVVLCASGADALKKVAAACEKLGGKAEVVAKRPSSEANCDAIVDAAVKRFGGVDILVVASGQNKVSKIVDQKAEDFLDVMDANVTQSWLMARSAGRQMLKQGKGGKVILMSSARGLLGHPAGYSAYCASKSAVDGITKALGCEWGGSGITV